MAYQNCSLHRWNKILTNNLNDTCNDESAIGMNDNEDRNCPRITLINKASSYTKEHRFTPSFIFIIRKMRHNLQNVFL